MTKPRHSQAPHLDLYQQVTNQIIAALEQVTSVNVVEILWPFGVAIDQAALGGSWSGSVSLSSAIASSCM